MNDNSEQNNKEQQHLRNTTTQQQNTDAAAALSDNPFTAIYHLLQKAEAAPGRILPLTTLKALLQAWAERASQVWLYHKRREGWHQYVRVEQYASNGKDEYKVTLITFDELDIELNESFDFEGAE
jgi:hypothetical protein